MKRWINLISILLLLLIAILIIKPNILLSFSHQKPINPQQLADTYDSSTTTAIFNNQPIQIPPPLTAYQPDPTVLGETTADKRIEIDLSHQKVYAFEDNKLVYEYDISSGKWGRTPTGTFYIWTKLRYTKMEGGSRAINTYYYLPNVPYVMFFANNEVPKHKGFSLHGTYWHNNFGHPMSHGCVNMRTEEVANLYYWARPDLQGKNSIYASADNPGTPINIYGEAPWE